MYNPTQCNLYLSGCDSWLWWLLIISLLGTLMAGGAMVQYSSFVTDGNGKQLSHIKLQGTGEAEKLNVYLSAFTEKDLAMIRKVMKIDFAFMICFYSVMVIISFLSLRHCVMGNSWHRLLSFLCFLPLGTLLFDVAENILTFSILGNFEKKTETINKKDVLLMSVCSTSKWITGLVWLQGMISVLVAFLVMRFL